MKIEKKELEKSQVEVIVELSVKEFEPYIKEGAVAVSKDVKIKGFRPGKVPFDVLKQKIGEMTILEQASRIAINKTMAEIMEKELSKEQPIGQPKVDITKLAPNNPLEFKVVVAVLPKITLGEYKGLKIKAEKLTVDEKDVEKTLEMIKESRVKEVASEKEIKDSDKVLANIQMFLDRVPIEGGQSQDATVIIGKEYFVPGFDKELIGLKKGDEKSFKLPYPEKFHQKNLAGKVVEFKIKIKDVFSREFPEMNDEFAKGFGSKNLEELKKNVKESIEKEKQVEIDRKNEVNIIKKIVEKTKFDDLPEILIESEAEKMMSELESNVTQRGGKIEDYLASIKKTRNEMILDMLPDAVKRVKSALVVREIAETEKVEVTKEEIEKKQEELLKQYKGYEKVEARVKEESYKIYLANMLSNQKVVEKLKEWNLEK